MRHLAGKVVLEVVCWGYPCGLHGKWFEVHRCVDVVLVTLGHSTEIAEGLGIVHTAKVLRANDVVEIVSINVSALVEKSIELVARTADHLGISHGMLNTNAVYHLEEVVGIVVGIAPGGVVPVMRYAMRQQQGWIQIVPASM